MTSRPALAPEAATDHFVGLVSPVTPHGCSALTWRILDRLRALPPARLQMQCGAASRLGAGPVVMDIHDFAGPDSQARLAFPLVGDILPDEPRPTRVPGLAPPVLHALRQTLSGLVHESPDTLLLYGAAWTRSGRDEDHHATRDYDVHLLDGAIAYTGRPRTMGGLSPRPALADAPPVLVDLPDTYPFERPPSALTRALVIADPLWPRIGGHARLERLRRLEILVTAAASANGWPACDGVLAPQARAATDS